MTSQIGPVRESYPVDRLSVEILFSGMHAVFRILVRSNILTARADTCVPSQMGYLVELCGPTREITEINIGVEVFVLVVLGSNSLKEICMPRIIGGRDGPGRTDRKFLDGPGRQSEVVGIS